MVILVLLKEKRRYNELQRNLSGITHRTSAKQLKEMEADGLVEREDFGEISPRVEYRLMLLGRSLELVLAAMHEWAIQHGGEIRRSIRAEASTSEEGPKIILQITPMSALGIEWDLSRIYKEDSLRPIGTSGWSRRYNFDEILSHNSHSGEAAGSYAQLFRMERSRLALVNSSYLTGS